MRFFYRITGSLSEGSPARDRRSADPRRARIECEMLEGRALMSNIPGVSLMFGNIAITAPKASGNIAQVSIAPDHNVLVSLNGQSEEFSPSKVYNVTYKGGLGGYDTFTNSTSLVELVYVYGDHNIINGGTSYNYVYFKGNNNMFIGQNGSINDVFGYNTTDTIGDPPNTLIQVYH